MKLATLAQGQQVLNLLTQKRVPAAQLQALIDSGLLADLLDANVEIINRREFREFVGLSVVEKFVSLTINGNEDWSWMVKRYGIQVSPQSYINATNLPIRTYGLVNVDLYLIDFAKPVEMDDVLAKMRAEGLEPARFEHLCAFFRFVCTLDRQSNTYVALGSVFNEHPDSKNFVPALQWMDQGDRIAPEIQDAKKKWPAGVVFLAIGEERPVE